MDQGWFRSWNNEGAQRVLEVSSATGKPLRSRIAHLKVFVPPQPPIITQAPSVTTTAGAPVSLTCESLGGRPPADVHWLDGSAEIKEGIEVIKTPMSDGKRVDVQAVLTFTPTRHHHNQTLTCLTHNPALNTPLTTTINVSVEYPPEVDLKFTPAVLEEGIETSVHCNAIANPSRVSYRWFREGKEISKATEPILSLGTLTRKDHGSTIACEATNSVGSTRKTQPLKVYYGPVFLSEPSSESAEPGQKVILKCRVDSNPPPIITWRHLQTGEIVGRGADLHVSASSATAGTYVCSARNSPVIDGTDDDILLHGGNKEALHIPESIGQWKHREVPLENGDEEDKGEEQEKKNIEAIEKGLRSSSLLEGRVHLRLRGPPVITSPDVQKAKEGGIARLECIARAVPHPVAVTWTKGGITINPETDPRFEIRETQRADGMVSHLVINATAEMDFVSYNCSVVNEYGMDVHQILLLREQAIPMVVVLGGGAGAIFVVIVVIIFILCGRRGGRRAREQEKEKPTSPKETEKAPPTVTVVPRDQGYMSYVDYSRDYSPVPVAPTPDAYSTFQVGGPYARSTPASDPPSSLPSSVAPPPYTPNTHPLNGALLNGGGLKGNGGILHTSPNGIPVNATSLMGLGSGLTNGIGTSGVVTGGGGGGGGGGDGSGGGSGSGGGLSTSSSTSSKHSETELHRKYIIQPQSKIKPGTLV
ncbi:irregular chiasm C-roughest protein-like isoform X2 [Oratosquilla oratoria]|uniref:irregular chiasm C-roughest protein-like isoform X2 n=1 Tax=Oratosquilla oratoria TaxID=337810 RepID=UPI003F76C388